MFYDADLVLFATAVRQIPVSLRRQRRGFSPTPGEGSTQVAQDIGPISGPNIGLILVNTLYQHWSETLAKAGPILVMKYWPDVVPHWTNIHPTLK